MLHAIFNTQTMQHVKDVPLMLDDPDGNRGLPDWFFGYDRKTDTYLPDVHFGTVEVDPATGACEWIPPVGPAPIWKHESAGYLPRNEMLALLDSWYKETFGD